VVYADLPCRITGEVYCVHVEWRLNGARALQRAGLGTVSDLLLLDLHLFWQRRLLMRSVNVQALGRLYNAHIGGINDRGPGPWDSTIGQVLMRTVGSEAAGTRGTTQALVDRFRRRFDVNRALQELDVTELLPVISADRFNQSVLEPGFSLAGERVR
jgi:hypothetical protein